MRRLIGVHVVLVYLQSQLIGKYIKKKSHYYFNLVFRAAFSVSWWTCIYYWQGSSMYLWLVTGERFYESFLIDWLNSLLKLGQTLYKLLIPLKLWFVCRLGNFVFSLVVQGFFMVDFRSLPLLLPVGISLLLCSFCNLLNPCRRCKCGCPCKPTPPAISKGEWEINSSRRKWVWW